LRRHPFRLMAEGEGETLAGGVRLCGNSNKHANGARTAGAALLACLRRRLRISWLGFALAGKLLPARRWARFSPELLKELTKVRLIVLPPRHGARVHWFANLSDTGCADRSGGLME